MANWNRSDAIVLRRCVIKMTKSFISRCGCITYTPNANFSGHGPKSLAARTLRLKINLDVLAKKWYNIIIN